MSPFQLAHTLMNAAGTFMRMAPMLLGVILCMGLFQTYVTEEMLLSVFRGNVVTDTLTGTAMGAVSIGQPVASYIIGGEMLHGGVSLYAVSAFIVSWVTVGFIQLPLEASIFGTAFTLRRNLLSLLFALFVAGGTAYATGALS